MVHVSRHIVSAILTALYFYGTVASALEKSSSQSETVYALLFKAGYASTKPVATSDPAKIPQRFVKSKERFLLSPALAERLSTHQEFTSNFRIHPSDSECACLFLACSSLADRAPPTL